MRGFIGHEWRDKYRRNKCTIVLQVYPGADFSRLLTRIGSCHFEHPKRGSLSSILTMTAVLGSRAATCTTCAANAVTGWLYLNCLQLSDSYASVLQWCSEIPFQPGINLEQLYFMHWKTEVASSRGSIGGLSPSQHRLAGMWGIKWLHQKSKHVELQISSSVLHNLTHQRLSRSIRNTI